MMVIALAVMMESGDLAGLIALTIVATSVTAILIFRPLLVAFSKRSGGKASDPELTDRLRQLEGRLMELEGISHRTAELEERLDFTERMLAQARDPERLRAGHE